jgi:hypothetical protein
VVTCRAPQSIGRYHRRRLNSSKMTDFEYLSGRRSDIRLRALANRMYQQERQRIFELRDGLVKVVAIVAGSVGFANVADPTIIRWCACAITLSSAASLVFAFGNKARDSSKRAPEWALLERDMERAGERHFVETQLNEWAARCNEIEAGEPAQHPVLWEQCYQRACTALGSKPTGELSRWRRWMPILFLH